MKNKNVPRFNLYSNRPRRTRASARIVLLVILAFALGVGGGALWFHGKAGRTPAPALLVSQSGGLSPATLAVLAGLRGKVDIHYYAILDPNSASSGEREFAVRTDQLLAQYETAAGGKLSVTRYNAGSDMGPQAAAKDGITPFNLDKGDACYLGIAVLGKDQRESFARLSPDWEDALESDLSRAIARVGNPKGSTTIGSSAAGPDLAIINEVKAALPNLDSINSEQGAQVLREAALKEVQAAIQEMSPKIQAAQKRLAESREGGSAAEQQAALTEFQRIQSEQIRRIQDISGHLQTQLEALSTLKQK